MLDRQLHVQALDGLVDVADEALLVALTGRADADLPRRVISHGVTPGIETDPPLCAATSVAFRVFGKASPARSWGQPGFMVTVAAPATNRAIAMG